MEHLNFLEKKAFSLSLRNIELTYFWVLILSGSLLFFFLLFGWAQKQKLGRYQNQLNAINAEIAALRIALTEKSRAEKSEKKQLAPTEMISLEKPIIWASLLNDVAQQTPPTIQFMQLSTELLKERKLLIAGVGPNLQTVSQFRVDLESASSCKKVTLPSLEQKEIAKGKEKFQFQMECWIK